MFKAVRFLNDFSNALKDTSSRPAVTHVREVPVDAVIYPNTSACSTLVIVPGLHPDGIYDRRMEAFAQAYARAGFQVVAPDIQDFRNLKLTVSSVELLMNFLDALPNYLSSSTLQRVGMLGISYGAGPIFLAASRKIDRIKVRFLIAIGGYADFERSLLFATTGNYGTHYRQTQEYGRAIFALNHMEQFVQADSRNRIRDILMSKLPSEKQTTELTEGNLAASEQQFLREIRDGFSAETLAKTHAILESERETWKQLSPINELNKLDRTTRIYLIHGRGDDLVPFEETEEIARTLKSLNFSNVRALTTASLSHVDIQRSKDLIGYIKLLFWLRSVLKETL